MLKYIHMPNGLSAEQAYAVLEFIWQLEELVQDTYEEQLREILQPPARDPPDKSPAKRRCNDLIPF